MHAQNSRVCTLAVAVAMGVIRVVIGVDAVPVVPASKVMAKLVHMRVVFETRRHHDREHVHVVACVEVAEESESREREGGRAMVSNGTHSWCKAVTK